MTVKKKPQPRGEALAKAPKSRPEAVQECPAYHICQEKKVGCGVCLDLPVEAWREHVQAVLSHGQKD